MDDNIVHRIEAFHITTKTSGKYINNINALMIEYQYLDDSVPPESEKKRTIDRIFMVLCGKSLNEIVTHKGSVPMDTVLIQQETIEELKQNYWNLRQQLLKTTSKSI